jgi:hypothetical protein
MNKKSGSGSGMNKTDHISENLENNFWDKIIKFFDAAPGSKKIRIRDGKNWIPDPGWKKLDPGSGINIPDPQHWKKIHLKFAFVMFAVFTT